MKDLYASDALGADNSDVSAQFGGPGMRHSIRPRRTVIDHEEEFDGDLASEETLPTAAPAVSRYIGDDRAPRWQDLPIATPGPGGDMPLVDDHRNSAAARAFDLLRTRLRQTTLEHRWVNIAVTAPTSGCGNSFSATNLALSLSRVPGSRTVLMDMNMRNPGLARAFDLQAPGAMSDLLSGRVDLGKGMLRVSDTLALGLNDQPEVN
ncbi:MAG TPA: tyrosine-protein kinase family protein, partial [Sulfitobacter sp.]|nr:tyrosine-protein kinase family protein [Sulfitobacter sp.]